MGCTRRIRQRFISIGNTLSNTAFKYTPITQAIKYTQQTLSNMAYGLPRILEVPSIIYHTFIERHKLPDEVDKVLAAAVSHSATYYILPQTAMMATTALLNYTIPAFEDSRAAHALYYVNTALLAVLLIKNGADTLLFGKSLKKAYINRVNREIAKDIFSQFLPHLAKVMAKHGAQSALTRNAFYDAFFNQMQEHIFPFFIDAESFNHIATRLESKLVTVMAAVCSGEGYSKISAGAFSRAWASVLTKIILSKIIPGYLIKRKKLQREINETFSDMFEASECLQDILNYAAVAKQDNSAPVVVKRALHHRLVERAYSLLDIKANSNEAIKSLLYTLADKAFILFVNHYFRYGNIISFLLAAELYGRSLLELRTDKFGKSLLYENASSNKARALSLGIPFATTTLLPVSYCLQDAISCNMLHLWSLAELQDKRFWSPSITGLNHFYIPKKVVDSILKIFLIFQKIYNWIEKECFKKNIKIPFNKVNLLRLLIQIMDTPLVKGMTSIMFGKRSNWPTIRLKHNWHDIVSNYSLSIFDINHNNLTHIMIYEMSSMKLFLQLSMKHKKLNSEKNTFITYLSLCCWLNDSVTVQLFPNIMALVISMVVQLMTDKELRIFLRSLNAQKERGNMALLKTDEQESKLIDPSKDAFILNDVYFYKDKPSKLVTITFFGNNYEETLANEVKFAEVKQVNNYAEIQQAMAEAVSTSIIPVSSTTSLVDRKFNLHFIDDYVRKSASSSSTSTMNTQSMRRLTNVI